MSDILSILSPRGMSLFFFERDESDSLYWPLTEEERREQESIEESTGERFGGDREQNLERMRP